MPLTYKEKFNLKHKQQKNQSNSLSDIARLSGFKKGGLQTIYNKGIGAAKTAGISRPQVKSKEQWAWSRLYSSLDPKSKSHKMDKIHLKRN
jgi:hypothetical protein